ncbi:hypothetical protein MNBD_GAMMA12-2801 [hydrothermal vent metagenome]|uniref:Chemotaxis phosphatase CheX-like domain-containing protein n=1 Tax=hydrothermal vent metagenome TaxID=652676 RepID=A0A3B0ZJB5_9ZZZZ
MDAKIINPVLTATIETLQLMANLKASPASPQVKSDLEAKGVISSILKMNGKKVQGSLALSFSFPLLQQMALTMLDEKISEVNNVAKDLAGELSNIVTGRSKALLHESGLDIDMAIPLTITGNAHQIDHKVNAPVILLPFNTPFGAIFVEICFKY